MSIDYKQLLACLEQRGMPVAEFAVVLAADGIRFASKTRLNEAFREKDPIPLRDDTAEQVLALWKEIDSMALEVYSHAPWAVMDLSDGNRVHISLEIFRGCRILRGKEDDGDRVPCVAG